MTVKLPIDYSQMKVRRELKHCATKTQLCQKECSSGEIMGKIYKAY